MTFDAFKRIVDETDGSFELQLEGGEPLLNKNLFLFLEYAVSTNRCKKIILLTNGILLEEHMNRLIDFSSWNQILLESNVFYLQSYGKLKDSEEYEKPIIVQNIEDWSLYASDGKCFGQDLIARSEYEHIEI